MILIIGDFSGSATASAVATHLSSRGVPFIKFDHDEFPADAEATVTYVGGVRSAAIRTERCTVRLDDISSAILFHPRPCRSRVIPDQPGLRETVMRESLQFLNECWQSMNCFWLPGNIDVIRHAQEKAKQLHLAASLGFTIPDTLITNSPVDFLEFYRSHGCIVSKLEGTAVKQFSQSNELLRFAQVVRPVDIGHVAHIRACPLVFQAYVPKRLEVRVTVVGARCFAAEIQSQATFQTRHDWRRYDHGQTPYLSHELPTAVADLCVGLTRALGLSYAAIDLVLTPEDRYVFLELNPMGQYGWIEQQTGLRITEAICDELIRNATVAIN